MIKLLKVPGANKYKPYTKEIWFCYSGVVSVQYAIAIFLSDKVD